MNPIGLLIIGGGVFSIMGALYDWDWFMESRKARLFVTMFGRGGARVVYGILGTVITVLGVLITTGLITNAE